MQIEKVIPPKLPRGSAIRAAKLKYKIQRISGISPELLGSHKCENCGHPKNSPFTMVSCCTCIR